MYIDFMSIICTYFISGTAKRSGLAACSDNGPKTALFIRTSEHETRKQFNDSNMLASFLRPTSEQNRQKRARMRAECVTIPKRGHPNMPLTTWGAGGLLRPCPPKARPNRLQTRQGEKTARWCTVTYIEGESSQPNDVSSDLERFQIRMTMSLKEACGNYYTIDYMNEP